MSKPTVNTSTSLQILRQTHAQKVLKTIFPKNTDVRDADFNKQDIFTVSAKSKAAQAYELLSEIPLGRMGKPEEVASLAPYFASDASAYVTGSTFFVDGDMIRRAGSL